MQKDHDDHQHINSDPHDHSHEHLHFSDILSSKWTLIVSVVVIICYLGLGMLFYTQVEGWTAVDSFYFTIITLTTVGYGDLHPTKPWSKVFTMFFIIMGISMAGYALGMVGTWFLTRQQKREKLRNPGVGYDVRPPKSFISAAAKKLLLSALALIATLALGTLTIHYIDDLNWLDAIYWTVVTCSTVGYGDIAPKSPGSRLFASFYILIGAALVLSSLGRFADVFVQIQQKKAIDKILKRKLTSCTLVDMDIDGNGSVSEQEFVEYMLVKTGRISVEEIREIKEQFKTLDVDGSGELNEQDLISAFEQ
eukprot:TRINITY_DN162_c0_g1_i1.p1 TRINITY_DN162_c0_g1~~TRINITY_DN162_c0_g1_i1.p1  ORF type:complete len:308 (+),score=63.96 TRINITY_DN162_c0_g1_i1:953-1876(+)